MTPAMQLSGICATYNNHPDKERIVRDLEKAMTLGHQFGIDRVKDLVDSLKVARVSKNVPIVTQDL